MVDTESEEDIRPAAAGKQKTLKRKLVKDCPEIDEFAMALTVPVPSKRSRPGGASRSGPGGTSMSGTSGTSSGWSDDCTGSTASWSRGSGGDSQQSKGPDLLLASREAYTTRPVVNTTDFRTAHLERNPAPPPPREAVRPVKGACGG